ncbi:MAG TPA: chorismate mutase [Roseiarcus sp.]|nr:chorismate mutase [Roseiarcus sp.]
MTKRWSAAFALLTGAALLAAGASGMAEDAPHAFWGKPSVDGGKCCNSLAEVRENIDRINRDLVRLMAERQKYVAEAGRFKANPAAVSAPARVEQIIENVKALARQEGLSEAVAEKTFRAMISGFEDYEREVWAHKNAAGGAPAKTP